MEAKRTLIALGFLLALLGGEFGMRAASGYIARPSSWPTAETELKASQLAALRDKVEVVFLGSSVTEAAVDADWLTELTQSVSYNSGLPWSTPANYHIWLEKVVFATNRPRLVVIGISPWAWSSSDDDQLSIGINRSTGQLIVDRYFGWSELVKRRGGFADWDRTLGRQRLIRSESWTELGHQTAYYELMGDSDAEFPDYRLRPLDEEQSSELKSLFQLIRDHDAEPVLLVEPARIPGPDKRKVVDEIIEELARVAAESDVVLWDTFSLNWPKRLFADDAHFNKEGTVTYTRRIAELIAPYVDETEQRSREIAINGADHGTPPCFLAFVMVVTTRGCKTVL